MNERQWLESDRPREMLAFANGNVKSSFPMLADGTLPPSDRKMRLFACAIWLSSEKHAPLHPEHAAAIMAAERWADGSPPDDRRHRHYVVCKNDAMEAASQSLGWMEPAMNTRIAALLRDIVGNPFGERFYVADGWLRRYRPGSPDIWPVCPVGPEIQAIAAEIYEGRRWGEVGVLADALIDRGCPEEVDCGECLGGIAARHWDTNMAAGDLADLLVSFSTPSGMAAAVRKFACSRCGGTGRVPHPLIAHLRGHVYEYNDGGRSYWHTDTSGPQLTPEAAREAHTHARGCWVLDCILEKK